MSLRTWWRSIVDPEPNEYLQSAELLVPCTGTCRICGRGLLVHVRNADPRNPENTWMTTSSCSSCGGIFSFTSGTPVESFSYPRNPAHVEWEERQAQTR